MARSPRSAPQARCRGPCRYPARTERLVPAWPKGWMARGPPAVRPCPDVMGWVTFPPRGPGRHGRPGGARRGRVRRARVSARSSRAGGRRVGRDRTADPPGEGAAGLTVTLAVLCAAQFVLQLDFSIVNVALPSIRRDLGLSAGTLQWLVTGYAMSFGSLLVLGGKLGDARDRRRLLAVGLGMFLAASVTAGLARATQLLIGARVAQGAAAALVSPSALGLLTQVFPDGPGRVRALSTWQAATAAGATTGVVAGGILTQTAGWRGVFLVNVPLIVALLAFVAARVPRGETGAAAPLPVVPSLMTTALVAAF